MAMYQKTPDIIIRNGTIVDGTGAPAYYADIAIVGDKIDYIGDLKGVSAPLEIDAHHKYVTPGFIDPHSHADFTMWANPTNDAAVRQGITTEVVGNCGFSARHYLADCPFDPAGDAIQCVYDYYGKARAPKGAVAAVLDKAELMGVGNNIAWLCGHNDLRVMADVHTVEPTEEQYKIMEDFLREAMEAGYFGLSSGLEFDPGILSKPEEVERLAMIAGEYDANYSTHMRDEGTYILEAINEFLNVIRKSGLRGTVSHLNVKYDNGIPNEHLFKGMQMLKDARSIEKLNVYADMLPTTFATGGVQAMLPPWLYAEGWDKAKEILADPAGREKVKNDMNRYWRFLADGQWDRLLGVCVGYWPEVSKTPFQELCKKWGKSGVDCFLDIVAASPNIEYIRNATMQGIVFHEQTMIDSVVTDPIYLWQTDSRSASEEDPIASIVSNMQDFMSMTYFFAHYVRDVSAISIEKAVNKATYLPAQHFKLENRGILREGCYADINVFDINALKINATFAEPAKYSEGMYYTLINGEVAIEKGEHLQKRIGRVLRHKPAV